MSDVVGKTLDELDAMRQDIERMIAVASENCMLMDSVPGQKLIKRLKDDTDAIRRKYLGIKGSPDAQLEQLHKLQGREQQLVEELEVLAQAAALNRRLGEDYQKVVLAIAEAKKPKNAR
jgi:hypothetical protein